MDFQFLQNRFIQRSADLRSGGIFSTKLHTNNQSSNIAKSVKRRTEPPLLQNGC